MRGFIQIPILIAILVSAIVFGGGGYYLSQKIHSAVETPTSTSASVPTSQVATSTPNASTTPEVKSTTTELHANQTAQAAISPKPAIAVDVCLNIEGTQTSLPSGYTLSGNACVAVEVKDLCPNIDGVQVEIPTNMSYDPVHKLCLTSDQLNTLEKQEKAAKTAEAQASEVIQQKKDIQAQIDLYNRFILEIDAGYYNCKSNGYGSCNDPYTPQNPIPIELRRIMANGPAIGGNVSILPLGTGGLTPYVKQQINFKLFDLNAEYKQLSI